MIISSNKNDLIYTHKDTYTAKHIVSKRNHYSQILKISLPWHVACEPNVNLLFMPIPYPDNYFVSHSFGILNYKITSSINPHVYVEKSEKEIFLPAGYPIVQIIPITENYYELHNILWDKSLGNIHQLSQMEKIP